ncbi:Calycin-like protein [Powellomyces hirtus]|nr:Calycin-like protein [Powellomyces hirtus]
MFTNLAVLLLLLPLTASAIPFCPAPPPSFKVDLTKYQGTWYEIGTTFIVYNTFEKDCKCITAEYTLDPAVQGSVMVNNTCTDTETSVARSVIGAAKQIDPLANPGYLQVAFAQQDQSGRAGDGIQNIFSALVSGPNYAILNIWGNYEHVFVGSTCKALFWILSRRPDMDDKTYAEIKKWGQDNGYNFGVWGFRKTLQSAAECAR